MSSSLEPVNILHLQQRTADVTGSWNPQMWHGSSFCFVVFTGLPMLWNFTSVGLRTGVFNMQGLVGMFNPDTHPSDLTDPWRHCLVISSRICSLIFHFNFSPVFYFAFKVLLSEIIPWISSILYWILKYFLSYLKFFKLSMFSNCSLSL